MHHYLLLLAIFLSSCVHTKKEIHQEEKRYSIDEDLAEKLHGTGKVGLLEHQLLPIDYMRKNPDLHGLLVNHYMGTGKTFLGIGFIQNYSDMPILVVAPRFLESQWLEEIKRYGVKSPERIIFTSYADLPEKLKEIDIKKYVVIADEVHNLIKNIRSIDAKENERFSNAYLELLNCHKFIALTGTPVYGDESDLSYMINLVSGMDLMPYNQESFRLKYTSIIPSKKFLRGYLLESNILDFAGPGFLGLFAMGLFGPYFLPAGIALGFGLTVGLPLYMDTDYYKFRKLEVEKLEPFMSKYISYFKFADGHFEDFPKHKFKLQEVPYNPAQYSYFLRLVEGDLPAAELKRLLSKNNIKSDRDIMLNSTKIHEQILSAPGAGRDIGNFDFLINSELIEAPKFLALYKEILEHDEPTVLYSNYYETGILAFEAFLKRQNFTRPYGKIEPTMKPDEVHDVVSAYNKGEIKLLLLHPDVTEGISLKATQFLHILEPTLNATVREQVMGRALRFKSHSHLPKDKQLVHITMWQSSSSNWDPDLVEIKRANWYERYNEMFYAARYGLGIRQVDPNYSKKVFNPEELSYNKMQSLEKNLGEMQKALATHSIETLYSHRPTN